MLTKFYRKNTSADATGTLFATREGIITNVIIFNDNDVEATVKILSTDGMIYFQEILPAKGSLNKLLDTYIEPTETLKFYSSLAEVHCTMNFLSK